MNDPILVATAGHVDHGKSTLIQALTGTDPDRWAEEKARGITIDLGYAHLTHADRTYSFIDVPGHERFVHNMLAGVGSIDAVLFVIAADESIMPQTREHALALRYLGVEQVHAVLTKVDLVDEDLLELLHEEVDGWLGEHGWPDAQKVLFSAKRPDTIPGVLELLKGLVKKTPADRTGFRLPIDRVFTSPGSGTVVTGAVDRGRLSRDDKIFISPSGLEGRIRQLQMHGQTVSDAGPHTRVALNLGGLHYKELGRGHCVFSKVRPAISRVVLVKLEVFEDDWLPTPKHELHLHHLSAHLHARMLWRYQDFAMLGLNTAHGFWAQDRGLIRDGAPLRVRAGFRVILPSPAQTRLRRVKPWLDPPPASDSLADWQRWRLSSSNGPIDLAELQMLCGEPLLAELEKDLIFINEKMAITPRVWQIYQTEFLEGLEACHKALPIYESLPLIQVQNRFRQKKWPDAVRAELFQTAEAEGLIVINQDRITRSGRGPNWSEPNRRALSLFLACMDPALPVLDLKTLPGDRADFGLIEGFLIWEKHLISLSPDLLIHHAFLNRIIQTLHDQYAGKIFAVADLKTAFELTRKVAIPLLEYLDKAGCTRRVDEGRLWVAAEPPVIVCNWRPPT